MSFPLHASGAARYRRLLAVDLDGTLVGNPAALAALNETLHGLRQETALAYVTGRSLASTLELAQEAGLLVPDWIAAQVGTLLHARGARWSPDPTWSRALAPGWEPGRVETALRDLPGLTPQPAACQGPYKRSYFMSGPEWALAAEEALRGAGLRVRAVSSSGRDLDILPDHGGKAAAVRHLASRLGVPFGETLVCGDSGNDRDMLVAGSLAAVVANAQPELADLPETVYRCRGSHAAGVHEALAYYGWC